MEDSELRYHQVAEVLANRILDLELLPGASLTVADIMAEFEVSRTVAREAQRYLQSMGLVSASPRVGLVVLGEDNWDMLNSQLTRWCLESQQSDRYLSSLMQLRLAIEPIAAGAAARQASAEQRRKVLKIGQQLVEAGNEGKLTKFLELDIEFHTQILRSSGNEFFVALAPIIGSVIRWRTEVSLMPPKPEPRALKDHQVVAESVYRGDADKAMAAMQDLVNEVQESFDGYLPNFKN